MLAFATGIPLQRSGVHFNVMKKGEPAPLAAATCDVTANGKLDIRFKHFWDLTTFFLR